jgi:thiamine-monophosphate kinase
MKEDKIVQILKGKFQVPRGIIGIGDDCAVLPYNQREYLLFTTDTVLEGVHFKIKEVSPYYIGYKALGVNVSDIAAMGGLPLYGVINLGLPEYDIKLVKAIYNGIEKLASDFNIRIVGGDTLKSHRLFLTVCMLGKVEKKYLVTRSGAKAGDLVAVTGRIGNSYRSGKHYKFTPRVKEARWVVRNLNPTSMIDVSDGLLIDLYRLCCSNNVGAEIIKDKVPLNSGVKNFYSAIKEGEDFELLFTIPSKYRYEGQLPGMNTEITIIGKVISKSGLYLIEGKKTKKLSPRGYDHFETGNF